MSDVHHHHRRKPRGLPCCGGSHSSDHHHHHDEDGIDPSLRRKLWIALIGIGLMSVSGFTYLIRPEQRELWSMWALFAAIVVSAPIFANVVTQFRVKGLQETHFYMDQFVSLAVLACFAVGQYVTATLVALILIVGQILEERSIIGVREAVGSLMKLSRLKTRRLREDGSEETVDAESLKEGDRLLIRPGETIPADATVLDGSSTVDQASITGESIPVEIQTGSEVFAGTTNLTGVLQLRVKNTGNETVLGRVRQIVEDAESSQAPIMRLTDRYARYYTPFILLIALTVFFFTRDINRAISVIIVSIPCAFILASPTAMIAALACASRLGILVKGSAYFEVATEVDTVVFDKTGTLTTGELKVSDIDTTEGLSQEEVLRLAASLENNSNHPLARAIVAEAGIRNISLAPVSKFEEQVGKGVSGLIEGKSYRLGRLSWVRLQENGNSLQIPASWQVGDQLSQLYLLCDNRLLGRISLSDTVREDAAAVANDLRELGIDRFVMLTGDRREVAETLASRIGFTEFRAECLPEDKQREVHKLREAGHKVLVIGDGINDAPALAEGNVGVAMGALGSDVAIKTANVALMANDLRRLSYFIALSQKTFSTINQNLLFGFLFILVSIVISSFGWISPIFAAVLHELSAFFVIFNSARLLRLDESNLLSVSTESQDNRD